MGVRLLYLFGLVLIILTISDALRRDHGRMLPLHPDFILVGLWFLSALGGYICVKAVHAIEWAWHRLHKPVPHSAAKGLAVNPLRTWITCQTLRAAHSSVLPASLPVRRRFLA